MTDQLQAARGPQTEFAPLPPGSPLAMPEQSLRHPPSAPRTGPSSTPLRRLVVFGATLAITLQAIYEMYQVLAVSDLTVPEAIVLGMFVFLFAWIALSFVTAVVGLVLTAVGGDRALDIDPAASLPVISARTAVLLPIYNEDPRQVAARLRAMYEALDETGREEYFDFFLLSDTTDPAVWIEEERAFLNLRDRTGARNIFYRHRIKNVARKAGNIADWVMRYGGRYDCMIVLDADSLMTGDTFVRLVGAMERQPQVGLIQTLPVLINGNTLFARIQQFAGRTYGPLLARGIAWWYGSESNYWGHNAIIRVKAFAEQAGLPSLPGRSPFGGHILSHDFVEAALLRRAGWGVHMAPNLDGSYEQGPPSLTDHAIRDRRWCQGNLQHAAVLPARGLHWMSRLHLLTGIGSYITAPLWLLFLLVGMLISLQAQYVRPEYFPAGFSLFPRWPAQDPIRAAWVFAGTMALLIAPKFLGYCAMLLRKRDRFGMGGAVRGFVSLVIETIISALMAPIMMVMQSKAVTEILIGADAGWQVQRRDDGRLGHAELMRRYLPIALLGLALAAAAYAVSQPLFLWMLPVTTGLVLAPLLADVTSVPRIGTALRSAGLLLTLEERSPPKIALRANQFAAEEGDASPQDPFALLQSDRRLFDAHRKMLSPREKQPPGQVNVDLVVALAKIADAGTVSEALRYLSRGERAALLADAAALETLFAKPR